MPERPVTESPAPRPLDVVEAFVNSRVIHHDPAMHRDHIGTPEALADWWHRHLDTGGPPATTSADVDAAVSVREGLRALLARHNDATTPEDAAATERLEAAAAGLLLRVTVGSGEPVLTPVGAGHSRDALAHLLACVTHAHAEGTWSRLKVCRATDCREAFYDGSRNRSRAWCSMSVCGARAKQRTFAERHRSRTRRLDAGPA